MNWLHRLFNPHCQHCIELDENNFQKKQFCNTCDSLKNENAFLREQVKLLMDKIVNPSVPVEPTTSIEEFKPITNARKPFSVIRNELEAKDRLLMKQKEEQLKLQAAKSDTASPIVDDEGKIDPIKVQNELENMNQEMTNAS